MFSYRCPSCGAPAYSSANASSVGNCPYCSESLAGQPEVPAAAPDPAGRWRRPARARQGPQARGSATRR